MSLLTVFSAPKPFTDPHIATIQRNALQSWMHLGAEVEVLLVGDEPGMAEVVAEYGVHQLAEVRCNASGTPLVSSIFSLARQASESPLLAYVNADILLLPDFVETARQVARVANEFLVVGQRWDLDVRTAMDFSPGWEHRLLAQTRERGQLHPPAGSDYFLFPRLLFTGMPDFAIGRAGWDNWMIYQACQQGWKLIDGSAAITVIHQNHDYNHLPGGQPHYDLDESQQNMALAGGAAHMYMTLDAPSELINGQIRPAHWSLARALRRMERRLMPADGQLRGLRGSLTRRLRRWRRKINETHNGPRWN